MSEDQTVLVTGASGFIATHVVQQLQQLGYRVRGTVRSTANQQKVAPLRELCPGAAHPLELVEADLVKEEGWKEAVSGCQYVIHIASPVPVSNPPDENDIIGPAVQGTLSVLRACKADGGVKRVVLTSSMVAVTNLTVSGNFTEDDWADPDSTDSFYTKSKILAEKAAWDFVAELGEGEKFELAVINPAYVLGPAICGTLVTSMDITKRLLLKEMPFLMKIYLACVDVRDVAEAHVKAMTTPEAVGHRHVISAGGLWMKEMAAALDKEFGPLGYNIPRSEAPYLLMKFFALFDKTVRGILSFWGVQANFDNSRQKSVLGIEPRDPRKAIVDLAHSIIKLGFAKKTPEYIKVKEVQCT